MHHSPLLGGHRIHLDRVPGAQSLLGGAIRSRLQRLPPPLSIPRGIHNNPFALTHSLEGRLIAKELDRIDRLPPLTNQQPVIVIPFNHGLNPMIVFMNGDLPIQIKLIKDAFNKLPHAIRRLRRPVKFLTHAPHPKPAFPTKPPRSTELRLTRTGGVSLNYRRFFLLLGGGGGGLAAFASSGVGTAGAGTSLWIVYCCPIVHRLVVIQ